MPKMPVSLGGVFDLGLTGRPLHYVAMPPRYKRFPPGRGNLLVPVSSKAACRAAIAMYTPSRRRGFMIQWLAWNAVGLLGPAIVPGRATEDDLLSPSAWSELTEAWQAAMGRFDTMAVHRSRSLARTGFGALLLREGRPIAFVKVRRGSDAEVLHRESAALQLVSENRPHSFRIAATYGVGSFGDWAYLMLEPLPPRPHRPARRPPLGRVLTDVAEGLSALPHGAGVPDHWVPMHGDCTPWNLRLVGSDLFLFDWESAAWGPPGADEVMYRSTALSLKLEPSAEFQEAAARFPEAVAYWRAHWASRIESHPEGEDPSEKAQAVQLVRLLDDRLGR